MKKFIKRIFLSICILILLSLGLLSFFVSTTPGLYTLIKIGANYLPGTLTIHGIKGRVFDQFHITALDYHHGTTQIKLKNVTVDWQLRSLLHSELPIKRLTVESIELQQNGLNTMVHNQPSTKGNASKVPEQFIVHQVTLTGSLNKHSIQINTLKFNYFGHTILTQLQVNPQPPYTLSSTIKINPKMKAPQQLTGSLQLAGDMNLLQWVGDFNGSGEFSLKGSIRQFSQFEQVIKWRNLQWPISATDMTKSPEGRIKLWGTFPNINLQLNSKINRTEKEQWQIAAKAQGTMPWLWSFEVNINQPNQPSLKREGLYTNLSIKGAIKNKDQGHVSFTVHPGHYQMLKESGMTSLAFRGGTINATLSPKELIGKGVLNIDEHKTLNLSFKLPKVDLSKGFTAKQIITSKVSLIVNSFEFLQALSPDIKNPKGDLIISLQTNGTIGSLNTEGKIELNKASIELPGLGLNLNAINLIVKGKNKHWEGTGSIGSGDKKLMLAGQGLITPQLKGEFSLIGADFPLINTNEYQIKISPQLKLNYTPELLNISGTILVPYAQIKPQNFSNSIDVSEDVVFKKPIEEKQQASSTPFNTKMAIQIEMGDVVELTTKGLHATLSGKINVNQLPQGPINAIGELNVIKGEYKAYGQNLAIEQGELIFTGGRLDNPGINLRASKTIDTSTTNASGTNQMLDFNNSNLQNANARGNITAGVEVTGRLTDPQIQLFSNPSILSQADILSMLVLGRPANQANKAGGQLLLAAISSMNLGNGGKGAQLLDQLKQSLGVDFNVQTNSNYNLLTNTVKDNTAFVVSKSLSKRISVNYNVGLSQADPNVLTLKYLLNKFFSIQVSSSNTSNGIDVLYTSSKK